MPETEYEEMQFELESAAYSVEMLKWRLSQLIEDHGLEDLVNEAELMDTSWDAIATYRTTIDPSVVWEKKRWQN
jgi:hypothetical protein